MSTGNTRYGAYSLQNNTAINSNSSAFGVCALRDSTYIDNTAVGAYSGTFTTTGQSNVSLGTNSLLKNTTGSYNTALGTAAMCFNETGNNNTAIGSNALENNTSNSNTAIGALSLFTNTIGSKNVAVGYKALQANQADSMTAVGYQALLNANPSSGSATSTAVGYRTLEANTTGGGNSALGYGALFKNTIASENTAIGAFSLQQNIDGDFNTAVGYDSLGLNLSGKQNTAIGYQSLYYYDALNFNTALGYRAGGGFISATNQNPNNLISGNNNTFLGAYADISLNSITNSTAIGYNSKVTASNQIMMGTSTEQVVIPGSAVLTNIDPNSYSSETSIVPKSYVDSIASGLKPTSACKCATTVSITLSGNQTIDGYPTTDGDRVLVKNQGATSTENTNNINNGIYVASSGPWSRASDCDAGDDVQGQLTYIESGTTNSFKAFSQISDPAIVGTNALQYALFYSTSFSLGNGLELSGSTLNVKSSLTGFLNFVGINGGTNTAYSIDTGATSSSDMLVNNLRIGQGPFQNNTCTALGYRALNSNAAQYNTAVGSKALTSNTTGANNTALGLESLLVNTIGNSNTGIGFRALHANTSGSYNVSIGAQALDNSTIASDNVAIGLYSLVYNVSGNDNVAIGTRTLQTAVGVSVSNNVAIGVNAGNNVALTSSNNTFVGKNAGNLVTSGGTNICIGYNAQVPIATASNQIAIGTSAETMYIQGGHSWKFGGIITTTTTLTAPLSQFYIIQCTANSTIKLPIISQYLIGAHVSFKRYANSSGDAIGRITFQQSDSANVMITYNSSVKSTAAYLETTQFQCSFIWDGYLWLQYNTQ